MFNTPVLLIVFNRPEVTERTLSAIKKVKPKYLFVAADGPREERPDDIGKCQKVKQVIDDMVDWDCELKTLYRDVNLGCGHGPAEAITWFFEHVEEGIILEDDCLPSNSFFSYCKELLERYREDSRIFLISGYNKQSEWKLAEQDYFYSNYGGIWGWASWRRAWKYFDIELYSLEEAIENKILLNVLGSEQGKLREKKILEAKNDKSIWDYHWGFARNINNALACVPSKSLIQNIGFGEDATHTKNKIEIEVKAHDINFPLKKNKFIVPDRSYDSLFFSTNSKPFSKKIKSIPKRFLKRINKYWK